MKKLTALFSLLCLTLLLTAPAGALEYSFTAPSVPNYGKPTSIEPMITADRGEMPNVDVSKDTAQTPPPVFPPVLGMSGRYSPTSAGPFAAAFTAVTEDLRYADGSLGTLSIPRLGVNVKIFEGTDSATLAKGAGHFPSTSIWDGNCCFAAHNRGVNAYFGQIHTLNAGDIITMTTKLGTRTYVVTGVEKVAETDTSGLDEAVDNRITLYTCVRDQPAFRWCVSAVII